MALGCCGTRTGRRGSERTHVVGFAEERPVVAEDEPPLLSVESEPEPEPEPEAPGQLSLEMNASQLDDSSPGTRAVLGALRHESEVARESAAEDEFLSPVTRRKRVVLVAGPPCAGKGTQCDLIVAKYGLVHISSGEILREHVRRDTALGRKAQPFMERGELVPTDIVLAIVSERMSRPDVTSRGCLLDNCPLTVEQAKMMHQKIHVDLFLFLDLARDRLVERARGRRVDPHTGTVYHTQLNPPPPEATDRLEQRSDDADAMIEARLQTYEQHIAQIKPLFEGVCHHIDGDRAPVEVFGSIAALLDEHGWGADIDTPYIGSKAFGGPFSERDARRGGFFSADEPPAEGEAVACFQRGANFRKQGVVISVVEMESDGMGGLLRGMVGARVTVRCELSRTSATADDTADTAADSSGIPDVSEFQCWAAFLAPINDMEYSSICTTRKYLASNYRRLCDKSPSALKQLPPPVPAEAAQTALQSWLEDLEDADGEPVALKPGVCEELVGAFASRTAEQSPSLYLYSTDTTVAQRTSLTLGLDYSKYYRALNNTLNHDVDGTPLRCVMPLLQAMCYDLCCFVDGRPRRFEHATRVWKGDAQRPVPLNRQKLREAFELQTVVRFRQFQSATSDEKVAKK
jgi:adenylate kinase